MWTLASVEKSKLSGEVFAPASKSVVHRALIAAALSDGKTHLRGNIAGSDVEATMSALSEIGAGFLLSDEGILVEPITSRRDDLTINARESGSTLRFFIPVVAALGLSVRFVGEGQLSSRPISGLLDVLRSHGITTDNNALPFRMSGKLHSGAYPVDGSVSSQYVTGLLLALPLLDGDSTVLIQGDIVSKGYIDLTLSILDSFSIEVKCEGGIFSVKGNQRFKTPGSILIEGDYSGAAFFAVGGAIGGCVTLKGLNLDSRQSDREIIDILVSMGADVTVADDTVTVSESQLKPICLNIENCPDLAPIISIAMATADGVSVMRGVDRLRFKESDRLEGIKKMLTGFSVRSEYADGSLRIYGGTMRGGGVIDSQSDHRLAMSAAIGGSKVGNTKILNAHCAKKSYPSFFRDLTRLGGKIGACEL